VNGHRDNIRREVSNHNTLSLKEDLKEGGERRK
jgi:hypothetical protein